MTLVLAPQRSALLAIDMQLDFAAPGGVLAHAGANLDAIPAALAQASLLVAAARKAAVTLVFTRVVSAPGDERAIGVHGGEDFVDPRPLPGELVITKRRYSAFAGTGLDGALKARGIDTLLLCGLTTDCCIQSTAWDAFERDLRVCIAADACAAYRDDLHRAALESLELSGAVLGNAADFAAGWK